MHQAQIEELAELATSLTYLNSCKKIAANQGHTYPDQYGQRILRAIANGVWSQDVEQVALALLAETRPPGLIRAI